MQTQKLFEMFHRNGFSIPQITSFARDEQPQIDFYPVALKIDSPKVIHKSDVGGVILDICNASDLERAVSKIISDIAQAGIQLDGNDRFIVVEMVKGEEYCYKKYRY